MEGIARSWVSVNSAIPSPLAASTMRGSSPRSCTESPSTRSVHIYVPASARFAAIGGSAASAGRSAPDGAFGVDLDHGREGLIGRCKPSKTVSLRRGGLLLLAASLLLLAPAKPKIGRASCRE